MWENTNGKSMRLHVCMSNYSPGEIIGLDAGQYGKAILEVQDANAKLDDDTPAIKVQVLESTHQKMQVGSVERLPANNKNLMKQKPGAPDLRDVLGFEAQ